MPRSPKKPWDAECDATRVALERFLRALVVVDGHFTDSWSLRPVLEPSRGVTVFFRVWIPEGAEDRFVELAEIAPLKPPPRADLWWSADDTISVYVAASALELDRAKRATAALEAAGIRVVSTWIRNVEAVGASNPRDASTEDRFCWSMGCLAEVAVADVVWFLAPAADAPTRGAWAELDRAHALKKRLVCSGDTRQSIFCALGEEYETDEEALATIVGRDDRSER